MSQSRGEIAGREALRARQGAGARYDALNAPADDLLLARRGAAFFARQLNALTETDFDQQSAHKGWSRRRLIAHISYQARQTAIALKCLREKLSSEELEWRPNIELAATLPTRALRHLYEHSDVHLNVEFRDLSEQAWGGQIITGENDKIAVRSLPFLRAQQVWQGAIYLRNGANPQDLPERLR